MNFSFNSVKAGVGLFLAFGFSLGTLIILVLIGTDPDETFSFEMIIVGFAFIVAMVLSPILATIVGAIISKDFDDESDAAFNGAISGAAGTFLMVLITIFFVVAAAAIMDDGDDSGSSSSDDDSDDDSDGEFGELLEFAIKGLLPSAAGGAIGAFAGFRFLWSQMPSSEIVSSSMVSSQAVVTQPAVTESVSIECPTCSSQIQVQKLGRLQDVTCGSCGTPGEIEI